MQEHYDEDGDEHGYGQTDQDAVAEVDAAPDCSNGPSLGMSPTTISSLFVSTPHRRAWLATKRRGRFVKGTFSAVDRMVMYQWTLDNAERASGTYN